MEVANENVVGFDGVLFDGKLTLVAGREEERKNWVKYRR